MQTNPTHCTFAEFMESVEPQLRPICEALRETITQIHPHAVEIVWKRQLTASYGIGPKKTSEHYACMSPRGSHVKLVFYRGAFLNDPERLLEGTGASLRHVRIRSDADARSPELKQLLRQAISERLASRT